MNEYELLKLSEELDEAIDLSYFTPEEIEELIKSKQSNSKNFKEKYFEFYDDVKSSSKKHEDW